MQQLQTLPHLRALSLGWSACDELTTLQPLSQLPSLAHLALYLPARALGLYPLLSLCVRLVSLKLSYATVGAELVCYLAQLPLLQQLHLRRGEVKEQTASAWASLHALHELQLIDVSRVELLLPFLGSAPALHLFRWRCNAPLFHPAVTRIVHPIGVAGATRSIVDRSATAASGTAVAAYF
jgi:hypothetical protein